MEIKKAIDILQDYYDSQMSFNEIIGEKEDEFAEALGIAVCALKTLYNEAANAIEQLTDIPAEEEKTKESLCLNCQSKTCWNEGYDTGVHNCKAYSPYQSDTNYSRIRSLSIYDMADELQVLIDEAVWSGEGKSNNELLEWLQSPAEDGE